MCETDCAPSTSAQRAVAMRASRSSPRAGVTVPSALETCGERDDARARAEQLLVFVEHDVAAVVDRGDAQLRARLRAELLPGHDVGVVLEPGDDDLVARPDIAPAPALRDEVDRPRSRRARTRSRASTRR